MKIILLFLTAVLAGFNLNAQSVAFQNLVDATADSEDRTTFNLSGSWLSSMVEDKDLASHLDGLWVLTVPRGDLSAIPADLSAQFSREGFELITEVRSGSDRTKILIRESNTGITDLIVWAADDEELTVVNLSGLILREEIEELNFDLD